MASESTVRCQRSPANVSTLVLCTSVSFFLGRAMACSNAYRATRSTPNLVLRLSWVASSSGVPRRMKPPAPVYGPSVPSRTTTMSMVSGDPFASGEATPGYSRTGRRLT